MVSNYAPKRTEYDDGDRRWLPDMLKAETHGVTLDGALFAAGTIKSGTFVGEVTTGGLHGPYGNGLSDGRQTARGLLINDVVVTGTAGERIHTAVVHGGTVDRRYLPAGSGRDAAAEAELTAIAFIN